MNRTKDKSKRLLTMVTEARARNNLLWMSIVKLALKKAPDETKKILEGITENDKLISKLIEEIVNVEPDKKS